MTQELIQNLIDVMDIAHNQRAELTELLPPLQEAQDQICYSKTESCQNLTDYFDKVKENVIENINKRLSHLLSKVESIANEALEPLRQCEDVINQSLAAAARIMQDGKALLNNNPADNIEGLVKFKDNPDIKALSSIPEVPSLPDVPYITIEVSSELDEKLAEFISQEGRILERAPVQIIDIIERPGGLTVKWSEIDEEIEPGDFCLEFTSGSIKFDSKSVTFHSSYKGPATSHTVRHLRTNMPYSFRVRCRCENSNKWSAWSVPRVAMTTIPHYEWSMGNLEYDTSNENKTATRTNEGETKVLYSSSNSYLAGGCVTFRLLDAGESSPLDGVGLSIDNQDTTTLQRENAVFLTTRGCVFVNGQEMKNKLPDLTKGTKLNVETEVLSSGKIRVSLEVQDKAVTFDWKINEELNITQLAGMGMGGSSDKQLYFGIIFSHEDWKIGVE
ncbi:cytokine receptor-like factor 3 [Mytilus edulis]|uniref:cytokine receptor-like factor 3 n=1 Tax=Mytilus edulis TaxID=6550 RepID=UPI0039F0D3AE